MSFKCSLIRSYSIIYHSTLKASSPTYHQRLQTNSVLSLSLSKAYSKTNTSSRTQKTFGFIYFYLKIMVIDSRGNSYFLHLHLHTNFRDKYNGTHNACPYLSSLFCCLFSFHLLAQSIGSHHLFEVHQFPHRRIGFRGYFHQVLLHTYSILICLFSLNNQLYSTKTDLHQRRLTLITPTLSPLSLTNSTCVTFLTNSLVLVEILDANALCNKRCPGVLLSLKKER
jgi:hypothetical protein